MRRIDKPLAAVFGVLIFYFILNQGYPAALIPALAGIWVLGVYVDLKSTFGRPDMMKYESNKLLMGCMRRYGTRRAVAITISYEIGFIALLSVLLSRPVGFDAADFVFIAGVFGAYHLYCARSNDNFKA